MVTSNVTINLKQMQISAFMTIALQHVYFWNGGTFSFLILQRTMTYRPILALVYCRTCGNIHACIQNQCSAIALRRHVFLELYDDAFLGLVFKTGFPHCLNMLWTTIFNFLWVLGPFWFWFIVGLPEMRWPACPTLCIADGLQFILQIWQCFCFSSVLEIIALIHIICSVPTFSQWVTVTFEFNDKSRPSSKMSLQFSGDNSGC